MPDDIIYKYKARKTLEELFLTNDAKALGFEKLVGEDITGGDKTRMVLDQELKFLSKEKVESLHVEYL